MTPEVSEKIVELLLYLQFKLGVELSVDSLGGVLALIMYLIGGGRKRKS